MVSAPIGGWSRGLFLTLLPARPGGLTFPKEYFSIPLLTNIPISIVIIAEKSAKNYGSVIFLQIFPQILAQIFAKINSVQKIPQIFAILFAEIIVLRKYYRKTKRKYLRIANKSAKKIANKSAKKSDKYLWLLTPKKG